MNPHREANRKKWNASADWWKDWVKKRGIWDRCHLEPELILTATELEYLQDIKGKKAAVLASGDNQAVFALIGLGAEVTSVDISEKQLETARERAKALGLSPTFLRADASDLSLIGIKKGPSQGILLGDPLF